jgi:hypothetical protein
MGFPFVKKMGGFCLAVSLLAGIAQRGYSQQLGISTVGSTIYPTQGLRRVSGAILSNPNYQGLYGAGIDPSNGYGYFGGRNGTFSKINLAAMTEESTLTLASGGNFGDVLIDSANGYSYFQSGSSIHKVKLGGPGIASVEVATLTLGSIGAGAIDTSNADPTKHYAYFVSYGSPATIFKLALPASPANGGPADSTAPTLVGGSGVILNSPVFPYSGGGATHGTIDPSAGYAYFDCYTSNQIVQIALNGANASTENAVMTTSDPVTTGDFFAYGRIPAVDTTSSTHYLYCGLYVPNRQADVVKINLTSFTEVSNDFLNPGSGGCTGSTSLEQALSAGLADPPSGYTIYGTDGVFPMKVFKVKNNAGNSAPTENAGPPLQLQPGFAMTLCDGNPGYPDTSPQTSAPFTFPYGEVFAQGAVIDNNAGYAYFGTDSAPGQVVKVAFSQKAAIKGTQAVLAQTAVVNDIKFYSTAAGGHVRLGIYDNSSPPNLLWDSGTIANTTTAGWITQNISSGSPTALTLNAGTYWLCWQVDSTLDIPSYSLGAAGTGLIQDYTYGAYPGTLNAAQSTSDNWSEYLDYTVSGATATNTPASTGTATPTATTSATFTLTSTATFTATSTPSNSATPTATSTASATPSITATSTPTGTVTDTVTNTPSPTPTETGTLPPTNTATDTPSQTATSTATNTLTSTASNSPTPTGTVTATATNSPTVTPTDTGTLTPANTPTDTPTQTVTETATDTTTPTASNSPTLMITATDTQTPTSTNSALGTSTPTNSPTLTVTQTPTITSFPIQTSTPLPNENLPYPNPWVGSLPLSIYHTVPTGTSRVTVKLFTVVFREIYSNPHLATSPGQNLYQLDWGEVGNIANGLYYLVLVDDIGQKNKTTIRKILIRR